MVSRTALKHEQKSWRAELEAQRVGSTATSQFSSSQASSSQFTSSSSRSSQDEPPRQVSEYVHDESDDGDVHKKPGPPKTSGSTRGQGRARGGGEGQVRGRVRGRGGLLRGTAPARSFEQPTLWPKQRPGPPARQALAPTRASPGNRVQPVPPQQTMRCNEGTQCLHCGQLLRSSIGDRYDGPSLNPRRHPMQVPCPGFYGACCQHGSFVHGRQVPPQPPLTYCEALMTPTPASRSLPLVVLSSPQAAVLQQQERGGQEPSIPRQPSHFGVPTGPQIQPSSQN